MSNLELCQLCSFIEMAVTMIVLLMDGLEVSSDEESESL
jgi:hypothetical protein